MADERALSLTKESETGADTIDHMIDALRVFKELGSRKSCSPLTDRNPKLLYEQEQVLRLGAETAKEKHCKIYIFDQYLIIASKRLRRQNGDNVNVKEGESKLMTESSPSEVVWFGSKNSSTDKGENKSAISGDSKDMSKNAAGSSDVDSDSEIWQEDLEIEELEAAEAKDLKESRLYNLKMWIDLGKVKVKSKRSAKGDMFGIFVTYVSKEQIEIAPGEYRHDDVVDQAKIWLKNDGESVAKNVVGIIQDIMAEKARKELERIANEERKEREAKRNNNRRGENSATGTDSEFTSDTGSVHRPKKNNSESGRSTGSASTGTGSRPKRKRRGLARAKAMLKATEAQNTLREQGKAVPQSSVALNKKDLDNRHEVRTGKSSMHSKSTISDNLSAQAEMAEFTVVFKIKQLGFSLSSGRTIGPFVSRVVKDGVAQACGVTLGDRVDAINDHEITISMDWKDCVKIIRDEQVKGPLRVTFSRKKKAEEQRLKMEQQKREMQRAKEDLAKEEALAANAGGEVKPVDSGSEVEEPDVEESNVDLKNSNKYKSVHMVQKKTSQGKYKYTMRKGPSRLRGKRSGGKRNFVKKMQVMQEHKHTVLNAAQFKNLRANKDRLLQQEYDIEYFFKALLNSDKDPNPKIELSKEEYRCICALKEIFDTEQRYHRELGKLKDFHNQLLQIRRDLRCKDLKSGKPFCEHRRVQRLCKMRSSYRELAVSQREVDHIFLNVKSIMKFNFYLLQQLKSKLGALCQKLQNSGLDVTDIIKEYCECFSKLTPFLQMYWQYCQRYTIALEKQKNLRKNNEHFKAAVIELEKHYKCKLAVLLMKPVQRITRYHLLFQTLKGHVDKYVAVRVADKIPKEELDQLTSAQTLLDTVYTNLVAITRKVNVKVGKAEELEKMLQAYDEIGGSDCVKNILKPHRRFVKKFVVGYEYMQNKATLPEVGVYVFNDMLVVAKPESVRKNSKISKQVMRIVSFGKAKGKTPPPSKATGGKGTPGKDQRKKSDKKKKLSLPNTHISDKRKKGKNKRASYGRKISPQVSNSRSSSGSRGSQSSVVYSLVCKANWKDIKVSENYDRLLEGKDESLQLYGFKVLYNGKRADDEDEVAGMIFYSETVEERDQIKEILNDRKKLDQERREKNEKNVLKHGKKKKKRRFAKKMAARKQHSEKNPNATAAERAKSSMYSTGAFARSDV